MPLMTLRRRVTVAEQTMAFYFERPAAFQFTAGQTVDLTLIDPPGDDAEGDTRTFSIASAPHEPDLVVAMRMRSSAFKRALASMPLGTAVTIEGPMGFFTLHDDATKAAVLLAGGIGVTPFRSIVVDAIARNTDHQLSLFYANHRPEDAAFLDELRQLAETTSSFRFVPTMTDMARSTRSWQGQTGAISRSLLERALPKLQGPIYYVAGPPAMVTAVGAMLASAGVRDDDVRTEEFTGY